MAFSEEFEVAKHVISCLNSTPIAVLSTMSKDGVWGTPVYFTHDDKFNFYMLSSSRSRHVRDIKSNKKVSLVIVMPLEASGGLQVGIQLAGDASLVPDKEIGNLYSARTKKIVGDNIDYFDPSGAQMIKNEGGVFIKIEPKIVMYLDRRYHGPDSKKVAIKTLVRLNKFII